MKCEFAATGESDARGRHGYQCAQCGRVAFSKYADSRLISATCRSIAPVARLIGPGTELKQLLVSLGITEATGCGCAGHVRQMNTWGVEGCREHFAEIRQWLIESAAKTSWLDKARAAGNALAAGVWIDPLDVAGSLVRIAIERASCPDPSSSSPS